MADEPALGSRQSNSDPVAAAHALLAKHYGDPVMPVGRYCNALDQYAKALREGRETERENFPASPLPPDATAAIIEHWGTISVFVRKSNLLYRLLYLGQPLRTRKCPEHDGHWSGCHPEPCPHGCSVGMDVTGWLP